MPKPIIYDKVVTKFLAGKSEHTLFLLNHFVDEFSKIGDIKIEDSLPGLSVK